MIKIGFFISIVLGILKFTVYPCSWWVVLAPLGIGIALVIIFNVGIDVLFTSLTGLHKHGHNKKMQKAMEEDQKDNPKYKDL